ncbi:MAG TPA: 3'-5' exonuclease, partial [Candidatus Omnitrophota bacterium]|nr:3'-5' exonuclease [Candidatus Omnitrophota bacterium]
SFCARVLRENPIEAGVDPQFRVLSEGEADLFMMKVLDRIFEEEADEPVWLAVLGDYKEKTVRRAFCRAYDLCRAVGSDEVFAIRQDAGMLGEAQKALSVEIDRLLTTGEDLGSGREEAVAWASELRRELDKKRAEGLPAEVLAAQMNAIPDKRGKVKEFLGAIEARLEEWFMWKAQETSLPQKREFVRVFNKFRAAYEEEKKKTASYDFEDLQVLTYGLFSSEERSKRAVRDRYREHFQAILVDEYQDTNRLQVMIIDRIRKKDNHFAVGDVQQSIFGFRYAEPHVFAQLARSSGDGSALRLSENFRSRAQIIEFVNGFFAPRFDGDLFAPLKPERVFKTKKDVCLEVLCVPYSKKEGGTIEKARITESKLLAARIRQLVDSRVLVHPRDASPRPIGFGDIAVLFRTYSQIRLYEDEMGKAGIPYYVLKGRGYYEKQEVQDLLNFLALIEDPRQDVALAGVLRSPLVGLSDDGLLWMARHAKSQKSDAPLWEAFASIGAISGLSSDDRVRAGRFRDYLLGERASKNNRSVSEMILRVLRFFSYEAKLLTRPQGRQAVANVRKLAEMAQGLEGKALYGIQNFISYIDGLMDREAKEAQASLEQEGSDTVSLSTVHAAKGLEFPCVVLADMGSKPKASVETTFLFDPKEGFGLKLKDLGGRGAVADASYSRIKETADAREKEELTRLFYVAMTRAEEHLVFSGVFAQKTSRTGDDPKSGEEGQTWMERLIEHVGGSDDVLGKSQISCRGIPIEIARADKIAVAGTLGQARPVDDPKVRALLSGERKTSVKQPTAAVTEYEKRSKARRDYEETADFTVSDLLADSSTDRSWHRRILDGLFIPDTLQTDEETPANEYGKIFHRAMEYLIFAKRSGGAGAAVREILKPLSEPEREKMGKSIERFWSGPWGDAIRKARRVYPELPFIYKTGRGILKGQIDLVFEGQDGRWVVLDYKTNRIETAEKEALARSYELQVSLYAFVFWKLYGTAPAKTVLYFESIHEGHVFEHDLSFYEGFEAELSRRYHALIEKSVAQDPV